MAYECSETEWVCHKYLTMAFMLVLVVIAGEFIMNKLCIIFMKEQLRFVDAFHIETKPKKVND